jgi:accessory colonization factor AcfC
MDLEDHSIQSLSVVGHFEPRRRSCNCYRGTGRAMDSQARKDADVLFGGADYMLTELTLKYPDLIDLRIYS